MCECLRGKHGRFLCCSVLVGMHLTGPISMAFFAYYFTLFVKSIQRDEFDWVILIWVFVIGLPRVVCYFFLFADSIFRRKIYALCLAGTTALQLFIFILN